MIIILMYPTLLRKNWKKKISYVPQEYLILDDSIKNNVIFSIDDESVNNDRIVSDSTFSESKKKTKKANISIL